MIASTAVVNLSMVFYNRFMSQGLGEDYARLRSLMALAGVFGAVTVGINAALARRFATDAESRGDRAVLSRLKAFSLPGLKWLGASMGLLLLAGPFVVSYLRLPSYSDFALVVLLFAGSTLLLVLRAALQGLHRFFNLGWSQIAEGLGRAALGFGLSQQGAAGGLWALAGSQVLGGGVAAAGLRAHDNSGPGGVHDAGAFKKREVFQDTVALVLLTLLLYADEFTVKHAWTDAEASLYGRAALVAKAFLYLASALNMVLLPAAARALEAKRDTGRLLLRFLAAALALNLAGLAVVWLKTGLCIRLLCGNDPAFQALIPLVRLFSAVAIVMALFQMAVYYLLALRKKGVSALLGALLLAYLAALQLHRAAPFQIVTAMAAIAAAGFLGSLWLAFKKT